MAITTVKGMSDLFEPILLAPPGLVMPEAKKLGIITKGFKHNWDLACQLKSFLVTHQQIVFLSTSISQSFLMLLWNSLLRRQIIHLHVVHGGVAEKLSYARKLLLNPFPVKLVAVSEFVKSRLLAHGVYSHKIEIVENFLLESQITQIPKRQPFTSSGINRVVIVSRLDPVKRVDLLFDALDYLPELCSLEFQIYGFGQDMEKLKRKAHASYPQVLFAGFSCRIFQEMANADLLLHLCPTEPFGLAILEAMAVGIPVLVPDHGGTSTIVKHGISGFHFRANDKKDLALCLLKLRQVSPELLNCVVENGRQSLQNRFSESKGVDAYLKLAFPD